MDKKFRWPISSSILIDAPVSKVWEGISAPGNLNNSHPFCSENTVVIWSAEKSVDKILYFSDMVLERDFFAWEEEKGYKLMIGRKDGRKTEVHWEIEPVEKEKSTLRITLYVSHLQKTHILLRWLPHFLHVRPKMKRYLDSVLRGFEHYITTGRPVQRNQFGSHAWFSSKAD